MAKAQILKETENFAQKMMADVTVPAHDFSHVLRVRNWAQKIAKLEKVDSFKIQMVALLHDIGRGKEDFKKGLAHAEMSEILARAYLEKIKDISSLDREQILEAIKRHSKGRKTDAKLTQVFQDADRLDAMGIIGIVRSIIFYHKMEICNSLDSFKKRWSQEEIDAKRSKGQEVSNDIVGSIILALSFYDVMNTKSGKLLAKHLVREMKDFLIKLKKEL